MREIMVHVLHTAPGQMPSRHHRLYTSFLLVTMFRAWRRSFCPQWKTRLPRRSRDVDSLVTLLAGTAGAASLAAALRGRDSLSCSAAAPLDSDRLKRWNERWAAGQTSWHLETVHPALVEFLKELLPPSASSSAEHGMGPRVLFPLCGKSMDMAFLARRSYRVVGVEGVRKAIEDFAKEQGVPIPTAQGATMHVNFPPGVDPARFRGHAVLVSADPEAPTRATAAPPAVFVEGDFLQLGSEAAAALVPFDAAFDRGGLVAVEPADRVRYAEVLGYLLAPGARLLLVTVEHDAFADGRLGPPFEVPEAEVRQLFGSTSWEVQLLRREDRLPHDAGMRSRGCSRFGEGVYMIAKKQVAVAKKA
eukprot:TRINITY_DN25298_c0_g3_i1.p1 TRINITY_DN25298_c0_g3~~TRINITY_DN25298_c0_g3_i1.p1  ORF type:complete len:361 (+),score=44.61 TRINITY_DN25298_c0_g3_i1:267-1349(+)